MAEHPTILTDLAIWDGLTLIPADTLILSGSRIEALLQRDELTAAQRKRAVPLPGATAMPGLIDAHVHMVLDPDNPTPPALGEGGDPAAMRRRAASMIAAGITSARDLGGGAWLELELRDAIVSGEAMGPRLVCSGQPITSPGGHCHFWGGEAEDLESAQAVIARQVERGVDLIKVMATGGRFTRGSKPLEPQFDVDTLTGIVSAAGDSGLMVAAHCHGTPGIEAAALAAVHSIEHCSWVGAEGWASDYREDVTDIMVEKGTWISPTIHKNWQRFIDSNSATLTRMRQALINMREAGIGFMASTDAGIPGVFHHHLPEALAVFAAVAQMSAEQTLRSATSAAAEGIGLGAETGRLRPGFVADVLIVDGDPLTSLDCLVRPIGIWGRGRVVRSP
jgi:imidazolonepropionase-like amidohydrolase